MISLARQRCVFMVVVLAFSVLVSPVAAHGESYQYRVSWNGIPAASATVIRDEELATESLTRVRVEMRTNAFVDLFWSLRAECWAEVDAATLRPHRFAFDRRINGRPEFTRVDLGAHGLLTGRYAWPGRRYDLIEVGDPDVLDPIAAVLRAQRELPIVGSSRTYDVFTGEARYRIELRRVGVETIGVPAGRFSAVRIEPTIWRLDRNERETRVRRITLWVTEGPPHTLLRVRSGTFIGAVSGDLTEIRLPVSALGALRAAPADSGLLLR